MTYSRPEEGHAGWGTFYDNQTYQNADGETVLEWLFAQGLTSEDANSDYQPWAAGFPNLAIHDRDADPDRDGLSNGYEYLFGLDSTDAAEAHPIQRIMRSGQTVRFEYTRRDPALSGRQPRIAVSTDLITWTQATSLEETVTETGPLTGIQTVNVNLEQTPPSASPSYLRIEFPTP